MNNIVRMVPACALAFLLAACGGSGSGNGSGTPPPAYAASVQQVTRAQAAVSAADYKSMVQHLYVAYFGRPADPGGLDFYTQRYLAAGAPTTVAGLNAAYPADPGVRALVDTFSASEESHQLYPGNDDQAFVIAIYRNLFNRDPEPAGMAFWVGALQGGGLTRARAALSIMDGAQNSDIGSVANKAAAAASFTTSLNTALRAGSYSGTAANTVARALLAQVGDATDLFDFASRIEASVAALVARGSAPGIYWLAGSSGVTGINDGIGVNARFGHLVSAGAFATDAAGNLYVADHDNHFMRKVTPAGSVTNIAGYPGKSGSADGSGATTPFTFPTGIATDGAETYYIGGNMTVRQVAADGTVTTIAGAPGVAGSADGSGANARFGQLNAMLLDHAGNIIAADQQDAVLALRRITPAGVVSTIARLNTSADGLTIDSAGNLYVADTANALILKLSPAGTLSVFAGKAGEHAAVDGIGSEARFSSPGGIAIDPAGNLYVTDNGLLRKITPAGVVSTVAGGAGSYAASDFSALPGSLPQTHALAVVGPKTLVLAADTGLLKVILP